MFLFGEFRIMTRRQFNVISMKRIAIFLFGAMMLVSCSTIMSEVVSSAIESDLQYGVNALESGGAKSGNNDKKIAKEKEKLKKEGKCPTCRGVGKTIDGKYVCSACNGTGKYTE